MDGRRSTSVVLDEPVRMRDVISLASVAGLGRESLAAAVTAAVWPFGVVDRGVASAAAAVRREVPARTTPVLLVHGYGANKSNWLYIQRFLRQAGYGHIHAVTYNPLTADIPALGARIRDRARILMKRSDTDQVHLIGHSMGGLVSRWAVQVAGLHEARSCITIASPHGGTAIARLGVGRSASQMVPGSAVLRQLARSAVPSDTEFVAYWTEMDGLVPPMRAQMRDPRLRATNIHIPGEGHLSIMFCRGLADSAVSRLVAVDDEAASPASGE